MKTVGELFGAGKMQLPFVLQSAETMKAAVALSRTAHGAGRGPGEGHRRARHGARRRPRHRQEPRRHHPHQQRLPRRQSRHQAADRRDPRRRREHQRARDRHVGPAGQIDRRHAREPRRDEPPGARRAGDARRRRADPALCRGGLRQVLRLRPRRLCPRRVRRARADGPHRRQRFRRLSRRACSRRTPAGRSTERASSAAPPTPRPLRPVDLEEIRLRRAELDRGVPVPAPPFWGAQTIARVPARRSCPTSTSACSINSSGASGRTAARSPNTRNGRSSELRPVLARIIDIAIREKILAAAGRLRLLALRRRGQRRDPVRRRAKGAGARGRALFVPAPEQGGRPLHRRFLPRRRRSASAT